jgi:hypothetical protein
VIKYESRKCGYIRGIIMQLTKEYYKKIQDNELQFIKSLRGKSTELILIIEKGTGVLLGEIKWNNNMKKHWFVYNEKHYRKITLTDEQSNSIKNVMKTINDEYERRFNGTKREDNK